MTYTDIVFLVLFVIIMLRGFLRGFIKEAISLAGLFFAYCGASYAVSKISSFHYYNIKLLNEAQTSLRNEKIEKIIIFAAVFLSVIIIFAIISFVITKIINILQLGFWNRIGGFFLQESRLFYSLV